jgi:RNA polymerase sigma-54 factor
MRLELRLEQKLILTPQLLMNLKLLQMPTLELELMIRTELETNPALEEIDEDEDPEASPLELEPAPPDATVVDEVVAPSPSDDMIGLVEKEKPEVEYLKTALDSDELSLASFLQDDGYLMPAQIGLDPDEDGDRSEIAGNETIHIADVILPQARSRISLEDHPIAEAIVDNLDEDGFLIVTPEALAAQFGVAQEQVNRVLSVIQHLECGGIGATNVREALMLQLEVQGYDRESFEYRLLAECFDELARKQYAQIARRLDTTEDRVHEAIAAISALDPKPGRKFSYANPGYVTPDFCVEWGAQDLRFYSTDESVPRLRLSQHYREILTNHKTYPRDQVEFARKKFQNALMLLKGIESRRRTLSRVMEYLVKEQREYFLNGREHLRPISIKNAGGALGIHPSTISRAVQGKYVETPYAILPMRHFFTTGTDGHARHSVKARIRQIVEGEDKNTPYCDDEVVKILEKEGIRLSRRTVAKYRSEMNIAACNARR